MKKTLVWRARGSAADSIKFLSDLKFTEDSLIEDYRSVKIVYEVLGRTLDHNREKYDEALKEADVIKMSPAEFYARYEDEEVE